MIGLRHLPTRNHGLFCPIIGTHWIECLTVSSRTPGKKYNSDLSFGVQGSVVGLSLASHVVSSKIGGTVGAPAVSNPLTRTPLELRRYVLFHAILIARCAYLVQGWCHVHLWFMRAYNIIHNRYWWYYYIRNWEGQIGFRLLTCKKDQKDCTNAIIYCDLFPEKGSYHWACKFNVWFSRNRVFGAHQILGAGAVTRFLFIVYEKNIWKWLPKCLMPKGKEEFSSSMFAFKPRPDMKVV